MRIKETLNYLTKTTFGTFFNGSLPLFIKKYIKKKIVSFNPIQKVHLCKYVSFNMLDLFLWDSYNSLKLNDKKNDQLFHIMKSHYVICDSINNINILPVIDEPFPYSNYSIINKLPLFKTKIKKYNLIQIDLFNLITIRMKEG